MPTTFPHSVGLSCSLPFSVANRTKNIARPGKGGSLIDGSHPSFSIFGTGLAMQRSDERMRTSPKGGKSPTRSGSQAIQAGRRGAILPKKAELALDINIQLVPYHTNDSFVARCFSIAPGFLLWR